MQTTNNNRDALNSCENLNRLPPSAKDRLAYTPREFAGFFGKSTTWGYRRLYDGTVKSIRVLGALMIPKAELERLLADTAIYEGRKPDENVTPKSELKNSTAINKTTLRRSRNKQPPTGKQNQPPT